MSVLSGWAASPADFVPDPPQLERMLSTVVEKSDQHIIGRHCCAVGVAANTRPASACSDASLHAAVTGNICWGDGELTALAKEQGDARAVIEAYRRGSERYLSLLGGTFALALNDEATGETQLAIDPLGVERLCYARIGGQIVFSTSLDGLTAHRAIRPTLSRQALFNYFYFHNIPAPETVYRDVFKLQPGEVLKFKQGKLTLSRYWSLRYLDDNDEPVRALVEEFHRLLDSSVRKPLDRSCVAGAFLSGGTDSSSVTAAWARAGRGTPKTFSIGFDAEGYDESGYARITADRFHTDHHHYYVTADDVWAAVPRVAAFYDEPFGNASAVPTYYCARLARENGVTDLLAGDGGDEIFAGNERYLKQKVFEYYSHVPSVLRRRVIEPVALHVPLGEKLPPLRKLQSYIRQANIPLPDRLETYNFLHRDPLEHIFAAEFLREVYPDAPLNQRRIVYNEADCTTSLNRMLFLDMKFTLADNDLRKVNGMCDLAGVNVHYPLIDLDMVSFAARVPTQLKIKGHRLRYFFKHALKDTLAQETLTKSKHGFGLPFGLWLNEHPGLHRLAADSLESFRTRGILAPRYVDGLWNRHRAVHGSYYGVMIWLIMMLECWLDAHRIGLSQR